MLELKSFSLFMGPPTSVCVCVCSFMSHSEDQNVHFSSTVRMFSLVPTTSRISLRNRVKVRNRDVGVMAGCVCVCVC